MNDTSEPLRYNFVFFFARYDFWPAYFGKEFVDSKNVRLYRQGISSNPLFESMYRVHWACSVNSIVNLPLKRVWFKSMYEQNFEQDLPICFVFMGGSHLLFDRGFAEYVRSRNPKNKIAVYELDLISKGNPEKFRKIIEIADCCITYDPSEAQEFGIHCFEQNTYTRLIDLPAVPSYKQDVYYLGAAKDRLPEIIEAYDYLENSGLSCKFQLAYVDKRQRINRSGIEYLEKEIPYKENLKNVIASRCILEITQHQATGMTLRAREALAYQRRLISNVASIDESLYQPGQLVRFDEVRNIDIGSVRGSYDQDDFKQKIEPKPLMRLYDLQEQLDGKK